ncbi:MAG: VacJ family lipoprotein, partial [Alphaproteobacteria bacterium]|nr:VacJ family lipoprotein [Alphaproteobacteria bacterium]
RPPPPLAALNAQSYEAIQAVDDVFVGPVAMGYRKGVPGPVRDGLRNFLNNLNEPVVFVNYLLQLKPGKALHTLGRFAINSTIGFAGVIDAAKRKPFYLAWNDNGFANTLACYGVKPGAFLYVPLVGSTTVRDLFGLLLDQAFLPATVGKPFDRPWYTLPAGTIRSLNDRVDLDAQLKELRASGDPYAATRTLYFKQRAAEIEQLCGRPKRGPETAATVPAMSETAAPAESSVAPAAAGPSAAPGSSAQADLPPEPVAAPIEPSAPPES